MKKLFAIFAVAGLLTACNNDEKAAQDAAKATADSLEKVRIADSISQANPVPAATDTTKSKLETMMDTAKAKMEGAANKVVEGVKVEVKEGANKVMDKVKEEVKK